jgi:hypothetical protein
VIKIDKVKNLLKGTTCTTCIYSSTVNKPNGKGIYRVCDHDNPYINPIISNIYFCCANWELRDLKSNLKVSC